MQCDFPEELIKNPLMLKSLMLIKMVRFKRV